MSSFLVASPETISIIVFVFKALMVHRLWRICRFLTLQIQEASNAVKAVVPNRSNNEDPYSWRYWLVDL